MHDRHSPELRPVGIAASRSTDGDALVIVAVDHPSLADDIEHFVAAARAEPRRCGPSAAANPKPSRALLAEVSAPGPGFRVAAVLDGLVVAIARVDHRGEVWVVVGADHRGRGVGTALAAAVVARSRALGYTRLVMRSSRRSRAALAMGASMGFTVVDLGRGRVDLILDLLPHGATTGFSA
jgi:GNAT superfamily N-acetyltransferase